MLTRRKFMSVFGGVFAGLISGKAIAGDEVQTTANISHPDDPMLPRKIAQENAEAISELFEAKNRKTTFVDYANELSKSVPVDFVEIICPKCKIEKIRVLKGTSIKCRCGQAFGYADPDPPYLHYDIFVCEE